MVPSFDTIAVGVSFESFAGFFALLTDIDTDTGAGLELFPLVLLRGGVDSSMKLQSSIEYEFKLKFSLSASTAIGVAIEESVPTSLALPLSLSVGSFLRRLDRVLAALIALTSGFSAAEFDGAFLRLVMVDV